MALIFPHVGTDFKSRNRSKVFIDDSRQNVRIKNNLTEPPTQSGRMKIEAIPTSYLVLEPGKAVGWIGNANLVPRDRPDLAYACALASKYMGAHVVISDSGSGAEEPAPVEVVRGIAKACGDEVFYAYGGGVKNGDQAGDIIAAGAHGIQIGTAFETSGNVTEKIKKIKAAMLASGKKRV